MKPKNQHQRILKLLIEFPVLTTNFLLDNKFHKAASRIGEIEVDHGIIIKRGWHKFTNQFGVKTQCRTYTCIDKEKARLIYELY